MVQRGEKVGFSARELRISVHVLERFRSGKKRARGGEGAFESGGEREHGGAVSFRRFARERSSAVSERLHESEHVFRFSRGARALVSFL